VLVCRVGRVPSAAHRKEMLYIDQALWQVESEFARSSGQALMDFNKLVLGSAEHKLFVGPRVHDEARFLNVLLPAACRCSGKVYTALVPHPGTWAEDGSGVSLWSLSGGRWRPQR